MPKKSYWKKFGPATGQIPDLSDADFFLIN